MAQKYRYQALTPGGTVARGAMEAESEADLAARLREQGHYLIRASPGRGRQAPRRRLTDGPLRRQELIAFTEYLATSLEAGIPILQILSDLEGRLSGVRIRRITAEIREAMLQGRSLSEALADHPKAFPPLVISTVKAGEATGHLDYALQQLVAYLDWLQEIKILVRQATAYPAIVVVALVGLVVVLVAIVYPKILPVLASFAVELPLPTRITMATALFMRTRWLWLVTGAGSLVAALWLLWRHPRGRLLLDTLVLRLPVIGPVVEDVTMARFVTYLSLCYATGVGILGGLMLLEEMTRNRVLANAVRQAREAIERGASLAEAFGRQAVFPPIVVRSLALGESTGRLEDALGRAKVYYDRELPARVRRLLALLNPALVVVLGGVVLIVGLSIILPIMNIYQSIGP